MLLKVEFNTQCSSQWDALCKSDMRERERRLKRYQSLKFKRTGHFYDQDIKRGYNDSNPSIQDLVQDHGEEDHSAVLPTLNRT